jgi:hypothetical protein
MLFCKLSICRLQIVNEWYIPPCWPLSQWDTCLLHHRSISATESSSYFCKWGLYYCFYWYWLQLPLDQQGRIQDSAQGPGVLTAPYILSAAYFLLKGHECYQLTLESIIKRTETVVRMLHKLAYDIIKMATSFISQFLCQFVYLNKGIQ